MEKNYRIFSFFLLIIILLFFIPQLINKTRTSNNNSKDNNKTEISVINSQDNIIEPSKTKQLTINSLDIISDSSSSQQKEISKIIAQNSTDTDNFKKIDTDSSKKIETAQTLNQNFTATDSSKNIAAAQPLEIAQKTQAVENENFNNQNTETKPSSITKECDNCSITCCCPSFSLDSCLNPSYNITAYIKLSNKCLSQYVFADFIYWVTQEEGMDLGFVYYHAPTGGDNPFSGRQVITLEEKFKPGFKVGLGSQLSKDNWSIEADYTFMHTTQKRFFSFFTDNIMSYWIDNDWGWRTSFISWKLDYDIAHLKLSRAYFAGTHLILTPSFGLKAGSINQKCFNHNENPTDADDSTTKSYSWLIGPRATLESSWVITNGFKFIGDIGGSIFFQKFYKMTFSHFDTDFNNTHKYFSEKKGYLRTNFETNIGFSYERYICNCKDHFTLALTYEFQYYTNQNMLRNLITKMPTPFSVNAPVGTNIYGDLMLHGLNFKFKFDF
jgi:hypothetical protein